MESKANKRALLGQPGKSRTWAKEVRWVWFCGRDGARQVWEETGFMAKGRTEMFLWGWQQVRHRKDGEELQELAFYHCANPGSAPGYLLLLRHQKVSIPWEWLLITTPNSDANGTEFIQACTQSLTLNLGLWTPKFGLSSLSNPVAS
jgi:hypothetical protein